MVVSSIIMRPVDARPTPSLLQLLRLLVVPQSLLCSEPPPLRLNSHTVRRDRTRLSTDRAILSPAPSQESRQLHPSPSTTSPLASTSLSRNRPTSKELDTWTHKCAHLLPTATNPSPQPLQRPRTSTTISANSNRSKLIRIKEANP